MMSDLSNSRWAPASHRSRSPQKPRNHYTPPAPSLLYTNNTSTPSTSTPTISSHTNTNNNNNSTTHAAQKLTKSQRDLLTRHSDLVKFQRLLRRLKWKSCNLLFCHHRALNERAESVVGGVGFEMANGEAEMMFKIDFFEFYVLLERVLVHLLGVFGMVVTAASGPWGMSGDDGLRGWTLVESGGSNLVGVGAAAVTANGEGSRNDGEPKGLREELLQQRGLLGDSRMFHGYAHRFHANVLAALDLPGNPLHAILGTGAVRDYLGIAKEFRNRWKDAEEKEADQVEDGLVGSRYERMLHDLKLEEMLAAILVAVGRARPLADEALQRYAEEVGGGLGLSEVMMMELDEAGAGGVGGGGAGDIGGDAPWEAMPDAMDLG